MTQEDSKPLTDFAPPPLSAAVSVAAFIGVSLYYFPSMEDPDPSIFTRRVFPDILSTTALIRIRLFFVSVFFLGFIYGWFTPPVQVMPPYRPNSKVPRVPFKISGWQKQFPFTSWSWNVLGISFALSTYIAYQVDRGHSVAPWLVRLACITWEIGAPMTLLIGAVVKYVLWPAQIKETGHGQVFLTFRALLQHNANVVMALSEAALMGGLPIQFSHISVSVLYGCCYILFSWAVQRTWHDQGPAFLYFFLDPTLGSEHTLALFVLLSVLMFFHGLFCGVDSLLHLVGESPLAHATCALALGALVCRFSD